jgi:glycosyltransferase involved in cell wall biosynthesis
MSRVLVEACSVGTPEIVHDYGLLAHFVRRYGLGLVVDCNDTRAFRDALLELTTNADATEHHAASLSGFAARFSRERFAEAVLKPSLGEAGAAVEQRAPVTIRLDTREG